MTETAQEQVHLARQDVEALAKLRRQFEEFLSESDEGIGDAMDDHFGFSPAAESLSASLSIHADTLEAAVDATAFTTSRTPT